MLVGLWLDREVWPARTSQAVITNLAHAGLGSPVFRRRKVLEMG